MIWGYHHFRKPPYLNLTYINYIRRVSPKNRGNMGNLVSNGPWKFRSVFFKAGELFLYYLPRNLSEVVLVVGITAMNVFFSFFGCLDGRRSRTKTANPLTFLHDSRTVFFCHWRVWCKDAYVASCMKNYAHLMMFLMISLSFQSLHPLQHPLVRFLFLSRWPIIPRSFLFKMIPKKRNDVTSTINLRRTFCFHVPQKTKAFESTNLRRFFFARWKSVKLVVKASSCLSLAMLNRCHQTSSPSIMTWCDMIWDETGSPGVYIRWVSRGQMHG